MRIPAAPRSELWCKLRCLFQYVMQIFSYNPYMSVQQDISWLYLAQAWRPGLAGCRYPVLPARNGRYPINGPARGVFRVCMGCCVHVWLVIQVLLRF
jgi:hypothetical protein